MPAIKLSGQVSDLQVVPEAYRSKYEKSGDGYVLKEIEIEDVSALKSTAEARAQERDTARAEAKAFKDAGVTIEEWNAYKASQDTAAADEAKKKGDWEANEKRINDRHALQLKAKDDEKALTDQALHTEMITNGVTAALIEAGANEQGLDWLTPKLEKSIQIVKEGGKLVRRVIDEQGKVRHSTSGEPMTLVELAAEFKSNEKYGSAFKASGTGGTGSQPNAGGGGHKGPVTSRADLKNDAEKAAYIHENGHEKYMDLPAGAGK